MNRLARAKRRLVILPELVLDQADRVQRQQLELHLRPMTPSRQQVLEMPAQQPTPPPPAMRGRPEPKPLPQEMEPMPDPAEELAQRLGLPTQKT
jgi:hypothetical protein